ncbi:MAG: 4'-phosphopantetheinyl transferase superfamily protein [Firmicutes bacterium]|nr:4'-phosphopantetheinyl transferase superfamily protein [Bacillota bacterium]
MKIGIDILEVGRDIPMGVFSKYEIDYIRNKGVRAKETAAGIYAAKEAYFKALGTGIVKSQLALVEVRHNEAGVPYLSGVNAVLSISHTDKLAVAVCVIPQS